MKHIILLLVLALSCFDACSQSFYSKVLGDPRGPYLVIKARFQNKVETVVTDGNCLYRILSKEDSAINLKSFEPIVRKYLEQDQPITFKHPHYMYGDLTRIDGCGDILTWTKDKILKAYFKGCVEIPGTPISPTCLGAALFRHKIISEVDDESGLMVIYK